MESVPQRRQIIVQKYIKNPLLINGLKWDLRIYVFVSSFCPLIAYISDDGLVRFATDQYTMNSKVRHILTYFWEQLFTTNSSLFSRLLRDDSYI